ncbi:hypothetical protein GPECTOR_88g450 [Gonium pectorale]|uniref:Citrate transporter-like domain-containing protein n=1 Tax=Gonium pectorale TaxID=33097 RepID=A0A150G0Z1_GONPE|nr:hypothetical protein GPECTOR_88g450 [Gonium pectorale]|eukprot:KXZ43507.1 hypothetical protein GPECTOR_88g450 [Gonium pectorale]
MRFRTLYNAAVVAVHREGVRVPLKVQDIVLQGGDVLLLSAHVKWAEEHRHDKSFVLLQFANGIISIGRNVGGTGSALIAIYIATALMSELLTNNAAGAIMYPIAAIAGDALKISPRDTSIAVMLGASAGFINPFSYQTNLMVYAAGNYNVPEFAKIGAPFQIWLLIVAGFILGYRNQCHTVWIVSWVAVAAFVIMPALYMWLVPIRIQLKVDDFFVAFAAFFDIKNWTSGRRGRALYGRSASQSSSDQELPVPPNGSFKASRAKVNS